MWMNLEEKEFQPAVTNVQEFPQFIYIFFPVFKVVLVEGGRISPNSKLAILW